MAAPVVGDDAVALRQEEHHLGVPIVAGERPAMVEHDRLARAPVLVIDLGAGFRSDRLHVAVLKGEVWIASKHTSHPDMAVDAGTYARCCPWRTNPLRCAE